MQAGISVKAGAAFLAGVMVALGGAVIYFKASETRVRPGIQVKALGEPNSAAAPDLSAPAAKQSDPPATQSTASRTAPAATTSANTGGVPPEAPLDEAKAEHKKAQPPAASLRVTRRPVSLAVSHPKKAPVQQASTQEFVAPTTLPLPTADNPATETTNAGSPVQPTIEVNQPVSSMPAPVQPSAQPHTVTIPAGTSIAVRLMERLSTDHNFSGDTFRATLDTPIVMDGFIIADRGAKVLGRVARAQKPGRFEGGAELSLTLTQVDTTDGQQMPLATNESLRKGPGNGNQDLLKVGGGAALGAIIGALAGGGKGAAIGAGAGGAAGTGAVFMGHGKSAVIENETRLTFTLAQPTTLTEKLK